MKWVEEKNYRLINSKKGMTLVEILVALALLAIIATAFMPLFVNYYKNIREGGKIAQNSYRRASRMERVISAETTGGTYKTEVADVPITFAATTGNKTQVTFSAENTLKVKGSVLTDNYKDPDEYTYAMYTGQMTGNQLACFPNVISDDFSKKVIYVVIVGRQFTESDKWNLYVHPNGKKTLVPKGTYYSFKQVKGQDLIKDSNNEYTIARITLFGANDTICFENSPLTIECGKDTLDVAITAPEIIMVGEGLGEGASENDRYYYATAGVDEDGQLEIIAKKMKGDAKLTSAMNDVEWVQPGMGDNGSGGTNTYGYYVMGGDAGQIRRFWNKSSFGDDNFYWDGDNVVQYTRNYDVNSTRKDGNVKTTANSGSWEGSYDSDGTYKDKQLLFVRATEVKYSNVFKSNNQLSTIYQNGGTDITDSNAFVYVNKDTANIFSPTYRYGLMTNSYATITNDAKRSSTSYANAMLDQTSSNTYMNVAGYKSYTGYAYDNTITITSVGAIPKSNDQTASATTIINTLNGNIYPTQGYTLYCGFIPSVINVYGCKYNNKNMEDWIFQATLGAVYSSSKFYPSATFADTKTGNWSSLLQFNSSPTLLASDKNDYYITSNKEVDVTIGYTSHPYAISVTNPARSGDFLGRVNLAGTGSKGSDYFFTQASGDTGSVSGGGITNSGKLDHSFPGAGLRDYITLLDIKSWHDDIKDKNFSLAGGYTLSMMGNDISNYTRIGQVYNTGIVYIKATGDGSNNDTSGSMESGKGWTLANETNVFHEFYSTFQYQNNWSKSSYSGLNVDSLGGASGAIYNARGWDTRYHKTYHNLSTKDGKAPHSGFSPYISDYQLAGFEPGKNTHIMEFCEVNAVNRGNTDYGDTELMWGTTNGTLMSWSFKAEANNAVSNESKITGVIKEFENYTWYDKWTKNRTSTPGILNKNDKLITNGDRGTRKIADFREEFFDYHSVLQQDSLATQGGYGFISVLDSINDVCYGDGLWVAVGDWSGKNPANYCASSAAYTDAETGTFVNVRVGDGSDHYHWKAVYVSDKHIDVTSVSFCNGWWYISGNDQSGNGVFLYTRNPEIGGGNWQIATKANIYADNNVKEVSLSKINSMASQEG